MQDPSTISIRPAGPADIPALHALVESAYRGDSAKQGWTHEADLLGGQRSDPQMLADIVDDPKQRILMAQERGGLVGCVSVADKGDHAYLGLLTVAPGLQGRGLGRRLAGAGEEVARAWSLPFVRMTVVRQRGELIDWYKRLGYTDTGRTRPFPMRDPRFGKPLRDDLEFIVMEKPLR